MKRAIMMPMAGSPRYPHTERLPIRVDGQDPYVRIQSVTLYVRDLDRSLRFYLNQLGFRMAYDARLESGDRFVAVSPPDGTAVLALIAPRPDSMEYKLIGGYSRIVIISEDVAATFQRWSECGVRFHNAPQRHPWGGTETSFEDVDGNSFMLVGVDEVTKVIDAERRAIADKLETQRRAAQELEIAKQVQARLFPQTLPSLRTLDYAGLCLQARAVGGDYYDFLDLGRDRLGLVVGDISGKGIAAALLMANLQANLRSLCATASDHPRSFLQSVNRLFCENTAEGAYATLFFAEFDDQSRRLRYASCGHLSALLLRGDNTVERLGSTGTVLGLFRQWDCAFKEHRLSPGDVLALYTDGITEASNGAGEEFGDERLAELLRRHGHLPSSELLTAIVDEVRRFSPHEQSDDITVTVAKCR